MGAFGAVTIGITARILMLLHGLLKELLSALDLLGNQGQISEAQRGSEGFGELHKVDVVEVEFVFQQFPPILRETHA
jgi:hypothetical protein